MEKDRDSIAALSVRCSSCGRSMSQHAYCDACNRPRACTQSAVPAPRGEGEGASDMVECAACEPPR